jgi:hypothetical protein
LRGSRSTRSALSAGASSRGGGASRKSSSDVLKVSGKGSACVSRSGSARSSRSGARSKAASRASGVSRLTRDIPRPRALRPSSTVSIASTGNGVVCVIVAGFGRRPRRFGASVAVFSLSLMQLKNG